MDLIAILKEHFGDALNESAGQEIKTLFESAVNEKCASQLDEKLTEAKKELEESNKENLKEFKNLLIQKLDEYTDLAVKEFVIENKVALQSEATNLISEKLITTLTSALSEAKIIIPESEVSIVKELEGKVASLTEKLNESIEGKIETEKELSEMKRTIKFSELTEGLADSQKDTLKKLVEGLEILSIDDFSNKVTILRDKVVLKESSNNKIEDGQPKIENLDENVNVNKNEDVKKEDEPSPISKYIPVVPKWR